MSRALVTGAEGFIGRRVVNLLRAHGHEVLTYVSSDSPKQLASQVARSEFIFHFAGVNRPTDPAEFEKVNAGLTEQLCRDVLKSGSEAVVVLASSSQAALDNPYGQSKRHAETIVEKFARDGGRAVIFRLPNVYGPGGRPNYNSVVNTFAFNAARGKPLEIHEPNRELTLVYVHDVAGAMADLLSNQKSIRGVVHSEVSPTSRITVQKLADTFLGFRRSRENAKVPSIADDFGRKLYATYLSYLEPADFSYNLATRSDDRGSLAEFLKSEHAGQIFVSRTRPGEVRGNHYHLTKTEKFLVLEGEGVIRFRRVDGTGRSVDRTERPIEYSVSGTEFKVVDIPPDYAHSIENVGSGDLVVLFWASEIFDPESPDTTPLKV